MLKIIFRAIHNLRLLFLSIIIVSFFVSVGMNPIDLGRFLGADISRAMNTSTSASVEPNPENTLALQLREKQERLNSLQNQIDQKEADLLAAGSLQNKLIWFLTIGIFILFFLIMINYYMDYRRRKLGRA